MPSLAVSPFRTFALLPFRPLNPHPLPTAAAHLLTQALGQPAPADLSARLQPHLTAAYDEDCDRSYRGLRTAPDLHDDLAALNSQPSTLNPQPTLTPSRWPGNAPFALFLSHDIDQIYDRDLFRILADINHVRRILTQGETGHAGLACRRLARALFRPKRTLLDFETILKLEGRHGFRSTFYLLHDRYWARQGARFSFAGKDIQAIGRMALAAGCELGVHGGYYRFNNPAAYRQSRQAVQDVFGVDPVGIRNHLLRFSYPDTWRAQAKAGFAYDATYGWPDRLGPRDCPPFPFFVPNEARSQESGIRHQESGVRNQESEIRHHEPATGAPKSGIGNRQSDLIELPLTVMDTTLFRYLRLSGEAALEAAWQTVAPITEQGGLVSLLWHNNFFNEPEYWDWQMVYERLLERLASLKPWCAPGAEINHWWRACAALSIEPQPCAFGRSAWLVHSPLEIRNLCLLLRPAPTLGEVQVEHPAARIHRTPDTVEIHLSHLPAGSSFQVAAPPSQP